MAQMWKDAVPGKYVRVEMPSRWYFGLVTERTQMTVRLEPVCCAHSTGDFGMFLEGQLSEASEVTPMPGALELNLITADTVAEMTAQQFSNLNRRTHKPMKKWSPKD